MLHPTLGSTAIERAADAYRQHYLYENTIEAPLFSGVRDMLAQLCDAGYLLAIATGKSRRGLDRVLTQHELHPFFNATRCADESRSKPHPDMLLDVIGQLEVHPQHALMIGDSEHDLLMASRAHIDAVAVTHGVNTAEELMRHEPLVCLDDVTDLPAFLSDNHPGNTNNMPIHTDHTESEAT